MVMFVKKDSTIVDFRNCVNGGGTFLCGKIKRTVWEIGVYQECFCVYKV